MRAVHVITPGDHFSPSTGSAIPTVVDGLCRFAPAGQPRAKVAVARGTYADRYDSADVIEYEPVGALPSAINKVVRCTDVGLGRLGLPRLLTRRALAPIVAGQANWESSTVFAHNLPQFVGLVDADRHLPVLYAHNNVLRTYASAESGRALAKAHRIVCVSQSLADQLAPHLPGGLLDRVRIVRNGVDAGAFRRPAPLARSGPLKVIFVGRMIPEKGADVLVEAVRRLSRNDVHLTLVGSSGFNQHDPLSDYERSVRMAAGALGERSTVRPFVPRAQVVGLLQSADVVVIPSRWPDPCPLTVAEGMAAGAAVVASDIGGIPETLRGVGILVRPNDPASLADALRALADDEALLVRTATSCRDYAEKHDWAWASAELTAQLRS